MVGTVLLVLVCRKVAARPVPFVSAISASLVFAALLIWNEPALPLTPVARPWTAKPVPLVSPWSAGWLLLVREIWKMPSGPVPVWLTRKAGPGAVVATL